MATVLVYGPGHPTSGYSVAGRRVHVLARAEETGAGEAFIHEGPAGMGPPAHTHPWDEAYLMLEGEMDMAIGERTVHLTPGMFVYVPAGTVHNFRYTTAGRFFSYTTDPGAARFFADLDREMPGAPPDEPRLLEVAARHHLRSRHR